MSKCLDCINCDLQKYPKHSNTGYASCKLETQPGVFYSIKLYRERQTYKKAPVDVLIKRNDWWDKLQLFK